MPIIPELYKTETRESQIQIHPILNIYKDSKDKTSDLENYPGNGHSPLNLKSYSADIMIKKIKHVL